MPSRKDEPSPRPLAEKLGVRPGLRLAGVDVPANVLAGLGPSEFAPGTDLGLPGALDLVLVFSRDRAALRTTLRRIVPRLAPAGMVWVCWPKRASGVPTQLGVAAVRAEGLSAGVVDVKVCAIDATWSGLKFVRRRGDRARVSRTAGASSAGRRPSNP